MLPSSFATTQIKIARTEAILASLASQFAKQNEEAFQLLNECYRELHHGPRFYEDASSGRLLSLIIEMTRVFKKVFVIVDRLDECGEGAEKVARCLKSVYDLGKNVGMALFSRDDTAIRDVLAYEYGHIQVTAHEDDLALYATYNHDTGENCQLWRGYSSNCLQGVALDSIARIRSSCQ